MKLTNFHKFSIKRLLFEQEEDTEDEKASDDEATDEDEEKNTEEETDQEASVEPQESSLDSDIEAVLIDFESSARKVAVSENATIGILYESEEVIDLDTFTADVARLVKNYDNLLDIEGILVSKSKQFIEDRYGEDAGRDFVDRLESQHDIEEPQEAQGIPTSDLQTPLAIGAGASGD